jgi:hypothetical protein
MADDLPIGTKMQQYPIDEMLVSLAKGLVRAQWELDQSAIAALEAASKEKITLPDGTTPTLISLGLAPSFYRFDQLVIDLSMELSMSMEEEASLAVGVNVEGSKESNTEGGGGGSKSGSTSVSMGASIDLAMSRKYGMDASAATHLSAVISAVDPPEALLEAFMRPRVNRDPDV